VFGFTVEEGFEKREGDAAGRSSGSEPISRQRRVADAVEIAAVNQLALQQRPLCQGRLKTHPLAPVENSPTPGISVG